MMPSVMARLKVEPEPVPRQPVALPVSPLPAKAGAPSRAQSKGRQASSTPTKVLKGSLNTSKGLQSSWAQSEAEAGPSEAFKTGQPEVGASTSQMPTVSALSICCSGRRIRRSHIPTPAQPPSQAEELHCIHLLFCGQDQAFTPPNTCTAPSPSPSQAEELLCVDLLLWGQDQVFTLPHTFTAPLPDLCRLKSSTVPICCFGGWTMC